MMIAERIGDLCNHPVCRFVHKENQICNFEFRHIGCYMKHGGCRTAVSFFDAVNEHYEEAKE